VKFHVYQDKIGDWRWRLVARNGKVIADSGEGYKSRTHAKRMTTRIVTLEYNVPVVVDE
jgi:uncharacterized protein YegP (UPF0339 family)